MGENSRILLAGLLRILLGAWIGGMVLFALVVAPTAFQVLPSTEMAGRIVSPVLAAIHVYGGGAGAAIALLTLALYRDRWAALLSLFLGGLCFLSHFGITAEITELREFAVGENADPAAALRFGRLHQISVAIYAAVALGALGLALLEARASCRHQPSPGS